MSSIPKDSEARQVALAKKRERMRRYRAKQSTQEHERAYDKTRDATPTRRADNQRKQAKRSHGKWALGKDVCEICPCDGEADNAGNYDILQVRAFDETFTLQTPGESIPLWRAAYFLLDVQRKVKARGRRAYFAWYGFHYDNNQMVGHDPTISPEQRDRIEQHRSRSFGAVQGPNFQQDEIIGPPGKQIAVHVGRKTVTFRFLRRGWENLPPKKQSFGRIRCDDVMTLEGTGRFENRIAEWAHVWTDDEKAQFQPLLDLVSKGKAVRGTWENWTDDDRKAYNVAELILLKWYVEKVRDLTDGLGLTPRSFAGPAPLSRALYNKYNAKQHIKPNDYDTVDFQEGDIMRDVRTSFHGGRIEVRIQGLVYTLYESDINSAHPYGESRLPCGAHGYWREATTQEIENPPADLWAIWDISFKSGACAWGPFPVRRPDGSIFYPLEGRGKYHNLEVQAYLRYSPPGSIYNVHGGMVWVPTCDDKCPFAEMIHTTYATRAQLKAEDKPEQKILKIALNSAFGVMAQTMGSRRYIDENGETTGYKTPAFSNLFLAGAITASTRALAYQALMSNPDACIAVMTDGVYSLTPLDIPKDDATLGAFKEKKVSDEMLFIAPGVVGSPNKEHARWRGWHTSPNYDDVKAAYLHGEELFTVTTKEYVAKYRNRAWGTFVHHDYLEDLTPRILEKKRDVWGKGVTIKDGVTYYPPYPTSAKPSAPYKRPMDKGAHPETPPDVMESEDI